MNKNKKYIGFALLYIFVLSIFVPIAAFIEKKHSEFQETESCLIICESEPYSDIRNEPEVSADSSNDTESTLVSENVSENTSDEFENSDSESIVSYDSEHSIVESYETNDSSTLELPSISTSRKLFTDYRCYNLWYTPHYRLQQMAWTDEYGLRRFNDDYIVGLGQFYSTDIGDRFLVTLDTGVTFSIILGDNKAATDCDERNQYTPCTDFNGSANANVLEFIVDHNSLPKEVHMCGGVECLDKFKGDIVKLEYLGRDTSNDWDTYETR